MLSSEESESLSLSGAASCTPGASACSAGRPCGRVTTRCGCLREPPPMAWLSPSSFATPLTSAICKDVRSSGKSLASPGSSASSSAFTRCLKPFRFATTRRLSPRFRWCSELRPSFPTRHWTTLTSWLLRPVNSICSPSATLPSLLRMSAAKSARLMTSMLVVSLSLCSWAKRLSSSAKCSTILRSLLVNLAGKVLPSPDSKATSCCRIFAEKSPSLNTTTRSPSPSPSMRESIPISLASSITMCLCTSESSAPNSSQSSGSTACRRFRSCAAKSARCAAKADPSSSTRK
mmetsp:Transcript_33219/g.95549  ORF Transcript_33219/g.95549 Transcript_33219/m.95549 type:complete len:290 (-) Transcript_33219:42-911(-)